MPNDWAAHPSTRARDIDREYAMGLLRNASVDGQLSGHEFEQRLGAAMHAKTLGELDGLVRDLQEPAARRPVPYVHRLARRKSRAGVTVLAVVGGLVTLLLLGQVVTFTASGHDEAVSVAPPVEEYAVGGNPLQRAGLDPDSAAKLARVGAPTDVPIPRDAEFDGHNWQSADTALVTGRTTYRWHLEYVPIGDEPIEPDHVADFYNHWVSTATFGPQESWRTVPEDGGAELIWSSDRTAYTLAVHTRYSAKGSLRVLLDITRTRSPQGRPDVPGEVAEVLLTQEIATVPGMTYEQSRVSQLEGDRSRCAVEQVWKATADQYAKVRTQATGPGVRVTDVDGGKQLTYSATADCAALAF